MYLTVDSASVPHRFLFVQTPNSVDGSFKLRSYNFTILILLRVSSAPIHRSTPRRARFSPSPIALTARGKLNLLGESGTSAHATASIMTTSFASLVGSRTDLSTFLPELIFCNMLGTA